MFAARFARPVLRRSSSAMRPRRRLMSTSTSSSTAAAEAETEGPRHWTVTVLYALGAVSAVGGAVTAVKYFQDDDFAKDLEKKYPGFFAKMGTRDKAPVFPFHEATTLDMDPTLREALGHVFLQMDLSTPDGLSRENCAELAELLGYDRDADAVRAFLAGATAPVAATQDKEAEAEADAEAAVAGDIVGVDEFLAFFDALQRSSDETAAQVLQRLHACPSVAVLLPAQQKSAEESENAGAMVDFANANSGEIMADVELDERTALSHELEGIRNRIARLERKLQRKPEAQWSVREKREMERLRDQEEELARYA